MYREEKISSRVCSKRWQERTYSLHRKKLQDIKPSIDNKTPQIYPHLYQKLKKAQNDEELCSMIERDNRTLVKRMTEIMQRPGIDTHNAMHSRSLNRESRKRELLRITQENQKLLKRIQARQPTYNHLTWEQEREKSEMLCERICRYPYRPRQVAERNLYYYDSPKHANPRPIEAASSSKSPSPRVPHPPEEKKEKEEKKVERQPSALNSTISTEPEDSPKAVPKEEPEPVEEEQPPVKKEVPPPAKEEPEPEKFSEEEEDEEPPAKEEEEEKEPTPPASPAKEEEEEEVDEPAKEEEKEEEKETEVVEEKAKEEEVVAKPEEEKAEEEGVKEEEKPKEEEEEKKEEEEAKEEPKTEQEEQTAEEKKEEPKPEEPEKEADPSEEEA